jgi:hypothetical protein
MRAVIFMARAFSSPRTATPATTAQEPGRASDPIWTLFREKHHVHVENRIPSPQLSSQKPSTYIDWATWDPREIISHCPVMKEPQSVFISAHKREKWTGHYAISVFTCWSGSRSQGDMRNEKQTVTSFMTSAFIDFVWGWEKGAARQRVASCIPIYL